MRRGTTPSYEIRINGYDLSECSVFTTLAQGGEKITLSGSRLRISVERDPLCSVVTFTLTQTESLRFKPGQVTAQIRFIDAAGEALATEIKPISVLPVLLEDVIEYEPDPGTDA